jgi:hypothetical protein
MEIASQLHHKALCPSTNPAYREYLEFAKQSNNEYYIVSARLLWLFPNAPWRFHYTCPQWFDRADSDTVAQELVSMSRLLCEAFSIAGLNDSDVIHSITPELLSRTIGMLRINVLGLRYDDEDIGFAMYPVQSLMNHSDSPNCRCVTIFGADKPDHPCLCGIEALRDIQPGEELFIDYVGPNKSLDDRHEALHFQYGINCSLADDKDDSLFNT